MESVCSWCATEGDVVPSPTGDEWVILASHVLHGMALPPAEFFCEVLEPYGPQLRILHEELAPGCSVPEQMTTDGMKRKAD